MESRKNKTDSPGSRLCLVTPCLNAAPFLEQTLRSVIDQPGFERVDYIAIDGGSTDGSLEILQNHKKKFFHLQSAPDAGLYHAVEEGFRQSDAEIMGWLNADDMLCPWTLRLALRIFDQLPEVSFITSRFPLVMDKEGVAYRCDELPGVTRADFLAGLTLPGEGLPALNFISQESTFWRRSLWEKAGGGFDHGLDLACDFELWSRFLEHAELHVVDVPLAMFRVHGANLSISRKEDYLREAKSILYRRGTGKPTSSPRSASRVRSLYLAAHGFQPEASMDALPPFVSFNEHSARHQIGHSRGRDGETCLFAQRVRRWLWRGLQIRRR